MGFFKKIGRSFTSIVKKPSQILKNPVRLATAVGTFGTSEVARAVIPAKILAPLVQGVGLAASVVTANPVPAALAQAYLRADKSLVPKPVQLEGAPPMGFNVGQLLGGVSQAFGQISNPYTQGISSIANIATAFFPQRSAAPPMTTALAVRPPTPMIAGPIARSAGQMVARGFFNRYPNLATAIQQLRDRGMRVKRGQLWSMLKRFGPEVLITGGLLTAAAVSELMVAGPGHRRMNAANAKALHRAARRIKSFHRMCGTIDLLKSRGRGKSRWCGTCRKSPCRC